LLYLLIIIFFENIPGKFFFLIYPPAADVAGKKNIITDLKTTLYKSVQQNNRFKKCIQGKSLKNSTLQGASRKIVFTEGQTKHAYITGV
jgi:hypothetical protein